MMKMVSMSSFVVLLACFSVALAKIVCKKDPCDINVHVSCDKPNTLGPQCPDDAKIIAVNAKEISQFLDLHNKKRALVASGGLKGFESAKNMSVLQWDSDLAKLAGFSARTCVPSSGLCFTSDKFPKSAENVGATWKLDSSKNIERVVNEQWFAENSKASISLSKPLTAADVKKLGPILHFVKMMSDRTTHIGCAMTKFSRDVKDQTVKMIKTVCVYSLVNFGAPLRYYEAGPAASKCIRGPSKEYPGLCNP